MKAENLLRFPLNFSRSVGLAFSVITLIMMPSSLLNPTMTGTWLNFPDFNRFTGSSGKKGSAQKSSTMGRKGKKLGRVGNIFFTQDYPTGAFLEQFLCVCLLRNS